LRDHCNFLSAIKNFADLSKQSPRHICPSLPEHSHGLLPVLLREPSRGQLQNSAVARPPTATARNNLGVRLMLLIGDPANFLAFSPVFRLTSSETLYCQPGLAERLAASWPRDWEWVGSEVGRGMARRFVSHRQGHGHGESREDRTRRLRGAPASVDSQFAIRHWKLHFINHKSLVGDRNSSIHLVRSPFASPDCP
jgi:hypothetical protein